MFGILESWGNNLMRIKKAIMDTAEVIAGTPLVRSLAARAASQTFNVVYCHNVGTAAPHYKAFDSGYSVNRFERDLRVLSEMFEFVSLEELLSGQRYEERASRPLMCFTFDDGLDCDGLDIAGLLNQYGVRATMFVITGCIGNERLMWRHMLSATQALADEESVVENYNDMAGDAGLRPITDAKELIGASFKWCMKRKDEWASDLWRRCGLLPVEEYLGKYRPYLTWEKLKAWCAAGHSVGFHTHTHPDCSRLENACVESEILQPARKLMERLGVGSIALSYPFGKRLPAELENVVYGSGLFSGLFGIGGFSSRGVSPWRLERTGLEDSQLGRAVFGKLALKALTLGL